MIPRNEFQRWRTSVIDYLNKKPLSVTIRDWTPALFCLRQRCSYSLQCFEKESSDGFRKR
jgi:hypothetical protein